MSKPTRKTVLTAIKGSGGVVSTIARKLGVDWHTAKAWIEKSKATERAYADEEETILDMADSKLYEAIKSGDLSAVKWIQSTKGKNRGYVQRTESDLTTGGDKIVLSVVYESDGKTEEPTP